MSTTQSNNTYDAIVVGTGISGGWAAKELSAHILAKYPKQSRWGFNEATRHFFNKDEDHDYDEVKRFDWIRGTQVGGRSLIWGKQTYRWSDLDFEANARDGIAVDWPIHHSCPIAFSYRRWN